jgi:hypothetical protein
MAKKRYTADTIIRKLPKSGYCKGKARLSPSR